MTPSAKPVVKTLRERQRELAEEIVKILRQNPALASSAEYERILNLIAHYTLGLEEKR